MAFHPFAMYNSRKYPFLPLWKFQLSFIHFFKCFGLTEPSTPRKFQSLLSGVYGYFLELHNFFYIQNKEAAPRGGGGVLPYKGLMGTCGQPGYVFQDFCLYKLLLINIRVKCLKQGIKNRNSVLNRVGKSAIFVLNRVRV